MARRLTRQQQKFKSCSLKARKQATEAVRRSASANFFKVYGSGMKRCM